MDVGVFVGYKEHVIVWVELAVNWVVDVFEHDDLVHALRLGPFFGLAALDFVVVEELTVLVKEFDCVDVWRTVNE